MATAGAWWLQDGISNANARDAGKNEQHNLKDYSKLLLSLTKYSASQNTEPSWVSQVQNTHAHILQELPE